MNELEAFVHKLFDDVEKSCKRRGYTVLRIDGAMLCIDGAVLDTVALMCGETPTVSGVKALINPGNRSFFLKTRHLLDCGAIDVFVKLFKAFGFNVAREELEEKYREAEEYARERTEKWRRIKRAWGIPEWF